MFFTYDESHNRKHFIEIGPTHFEFDPPTIARKRTFQENLDTKTPRKVEQQATRTTQFSNTFMAHNPISQTSPQPTPAEPGKKQHPKSGRCSGYNNH